ncbi:MAG: hypothetical protein M3Q81_04160, partial [bacterium]|nr:hypothetical protein [bacterium]
MLTRILLKAKHDWPVFVGLLLALIFSLINISSSNHVIWNIEPYPDALFYTTTGESFASGHGLNLQFQGTELRP